MGSLQCSCPWPTRRSFGGMSCSALLKPSKVLRVKGRNLHPHSEPRSKTASPGSRKWSETQPRSQVPQNGQKGSPAPRFHKMVRKAAPFPGSTKWSERKPRSQVPQNGQKGRPVHRVHKRLRRPPRSPVSSQSNERAAKQGVAAARRRRRVSDSEPHASLVQLSPEKTLLA